MMGPIDLPPEIERVSDLLVKQRPRARDTFGYAGVLSMIDDEKAHVIGRRVEEESEWLTIETVAGEVFQIMRPPISEEVEARLMGQVGARGIIMAIQR